MVNKEKLAMAFPLSILVLAALFISPTISWPHDHSSFNPTSVTSWCKQTPHPGPCEYFMSNNPKYATYSVKGKSDFLEMSLNLALERAKHAHENTHALGSKCRNKLEKAAWEDCLELYDYAIQRINETVDPKTKCSAADKQTYLSTAMTYLETCKQGFRDLGVADYMMPFMTNNVSSLISNTLAINKVPYNEPEYKDGFPSWVDSHDRKLLQAAAPRPNIVVAQDGSGNYRTIAQAVAAASKLSGRIVIKINAGTYRENVEVGKGLKNVMFLGDGIGRTIVTGSRSVGGGSTTFRSATVAAVGERFMARGITFRNTAGPQNHQAVAFRSGSDLSVFYQCSFEGYQDTLYVHSNRQFYRECNIYGTVDFIFGNAAVVLQNCNIYPRRPPAGTNTITAQGRTDPNQNTGISIHNSRVTPASDLTPVLGSTKTYLGRPWKEYSRTVFMKTFLGSLINPAGWMPWSGNFALNTLYYGEYANTGPGSSTANRVKWGGYHVITSPAVAARFTPGSFIGANSWLPGTGVPFTAGL